MVLRVKSELLEGGDAPVRMTLCYRALDVPAAPTACAEAGQPTTEPYDFSSDSGEITWELAVPVPEDEGDTLVLKIQANVSAPLDLVCEAHRELGG